MLKFNQAWMINPHEPTALWGMAVATSRSGDGLKAAELMAEARSRGDYYGNARFLSDSGLIFLKMAVRSRYQSEWGESIKFFSTAYRIDPKLRVNLLNWSLAYLVHAQYEEAASKLELALATPEGEVISQEYIALVEGKVNRRIVKKEK